MAQVVDVLACGGKVGELKHSVEILLLVEVLLRETRRVS